MRAAALAIVTALVLAACSLGGHSAPPASSPKATPIRAGSSPTPNPSASANPSPAPLSGSFGVLATRPTPGVPIVISIVGTDGHIASTATAQARSVFTCTGAGPILPVATVSASNSRLYYLDGDTTVRYLGPDGSKGAATQVPGGGQIGSTFAVSPDDRRIAVVAADYSQLALAFRIYVEDLAGGRNHVEIFSDNGAHGIPWAMGWRAGHVVLGYTAGCTQGGGRFPVFFQELHVVDAASAVRLATLGNGSSCPVVSLPSAGGVLCQESGGRVNVADWQSGALRPALASESGYFQYALSPSGRSFAACCNAAGGTQVFTGTQSSVPGGGATSGWIDEGHLLIGATSSREQARVVSISSGAPTTLPVSATGDFVATIPGGLDPGRGT